MNTYRSRFYLLGDSVKPTLLRAKSGLVGGNREFSVRFALVLRDII